MEERKFPKFKFDEPVNFGGGGGLKQKTSEFSRRLFVFTKFVLGVCLLPFVYFSTISFLSQFGLMDKPFQDHFWRGVVTFLIIYLFAWEPAIIYVKGQKLTELFFSFFKPLVRVAPYLLPVYTLLLLIIYGALSGFLKGALNYFVFLFGFTLCMHLVFSAKTIRGKKEDFFKANYMFSFSLIYIINLLLVAFFLSIVFEKFSFVLLCKNAYQSAQELFGAVFNQLFVNK